MYYAYVIQNPEGLLYKGSADNLVKRTNQHNSNSGFPSFTAGQGPWKLVYQEEFLTRAEAEAKEKYFKSGAGRRFLKEKLKK